MFKREQFFFDDRWDGPTGIGRYCRELKRRFSSSLSLPLRGNPAGALDVIWLTTFMLLNGRARVVSPGFAAPLLGLSRFVLSVHDLNHVDTSHNTGFLKRLYYRCVLLRACRKAAVVLTVSEFSKNRILAWSGASADRVVVVGNGVSEVFLSSSKNDVTRDAERGYILCVGNRKAHKNEQAAVRALAALEDYPELRLVFSGEPSDDLVELARQFGVEDRVRFTGFVSEEQLASLYANASLLLFPSLYEGFGLPAVEAMATGCPVIASRTTALGEVCDDAAVLVSPESDEEIIEAVDAVLASVDLRLELKLRGLRRADVFSWAAVHQRAEAAVAGAFGIKVPLK